MGNTTGRMTGLTMLTPIRPQWLWLLRIGFFGGRFFPMAQNAILQFDFIHYVRWAIVDGLPGEKLRYRYLFFESNFDGPWQHYIDAFAYVVPKWIRLTWGRGPSFPGPPPAEPLKAWIAMNSLDGGHYYCAYPEASTRMVKGALEVRERFERLVEDSARLEPEAFAAAYERFLVESQAPAVNRVGAVYSLTVIAPIVAGREAEAREAIEALPVGFLARLENLHFSRIHVVSELVFQGPQQRHRDQLRASQLVFTSTFDGELEPYLEALRAVRRHVVALLRRLSRQRRRGVRALGARPPDRQQPVRLRPPGGHRARRAREPRPARADRRLRDRRARARAGRAPAPLPRRVRRMRRRIDRPPRSTSPTSRATSCAATRTRARCTCSCGSSTPSACGR